MTTFTVQVKDSDAEVVLTILKKFKAKIIDTPQVSSLTEEIATALKEVKNIQSGEAKSPSLKDI
ncbi:hypothetical protein FFF34_010040 [Inquilinus sp. KBS0705]|nr:hypothetical protein FFF34_010040 [Inquilinus sp. KBS0705]